MLSIDLPNSQPAVKGNNMKLYLYTAESQKQSLKAERRSWGIFPLLATGAQVTDSLT